MQRIKKTLFTSKLVTIGILLVIHLVTSAIVDEAGYNIESVSSGLLLTAIAPEVNQNLSIVITEKDNGFARNQKWGVKFYGNDKVIGAGDNRQNNISVEWLPNFNRYVAITYDLDGVCVNGIISERNQIYQVRNKKTGKCLIENSGIVVFDECKGDKASWKFIRVG